MVAPAVLSSVQSYLRRLRQEGVTVRFGVLFGSQTTGAADEDSDIDLLVVSPQFDGSIDRRDVDRLWDAAALTDSRIEPVPCGERSWREDTRIPIIEIARREGTRVDLDDER